MPAVVIVEAAFLFPLSVDWRDGGWHGEASPENDLFDSLLRFDVQRGLVVPLREKESLAGRFYPAIAGTRQRQQFGCHSGYRGMQAGLLHWRWRPGNSSESGRLVEQTADEIVGKYVWARERNGAMECT